MKRVLRSRGAPLWSDVRMQMGEAWEGGVDVDFTVIRANPADGYPWSGDRGVEKLGLTESQRCGIWETPHGSIRIDHDESVPEGEVVWEVRDDR